MNEIGLLITGLITTKQTSLPPNSPIEPVLQLANSEQNQARDKSTLVGFGAQIYPPEFMSIPEISKGMGSRISANDFRIVKAYYTTSGDKKAIDVATGIERFKGKPMPTLRFGHSGTAVRVLQKLLIYHGYAMRVDGAFGPLTETAVKAFQNRSRVAVDGVVGPSTWSQLSI